MATHVRPQRDTARASTLIVDDDAGAQDSRRVYSSVQNHADRRFDRPSPDAAGEIPIRHALPAQRAQNPDERMPTTPSTPFYDACRFRIVSWGTQGDHAGTRCLRWVEFP